MCKRSAIIHLFLLFLSFFLPSFPPSYGGLCLVNLLVQYVARDSGVASKITALFHKPLGRWWPRTNRRQGGETVWTEGRPNMAIEFLKNKDKIYKKNYTSARIENWRQNRRIPPNAALALAYSVHHGTAQRQTPPSQPVAATWAPLQRSYWPRHSAVTPLPRPSSQPIRSKLLPRPPKPLLGRENGRVMEPHLPLARRLFGFFLVFFLFLFSFFHHHNHRHHATSIITTHDASFFFFFSCVFCSWILFFSHQRAASLTKLSIRSSCSSFSSLSPSLSLVTD